MYSSKKFIYISQDILKELGKEKVEFILIFFCRNDNPVEYKIINKGSKSKCYFAKTELKEIIKICKESGYDGVVFAHNHPHVPFLENIINALGLFYNKRKYSLSDPSGADLNLTHSVKHSLIYSNIKLLDHIIISTDIVFSFENNGYME
jgi:DNA repair protein RadC